MGKTFPFALCKEKKNKMKILYYFKNQNTNMQQWQNAHIIDELAHHNCQVEIFNPLEYESTDTANEEAVRKAISDHYDLFMTGYGDSDFCIESIKSLKKAGIPTLLICFDTLIAPYVYKRVCRHYDAVWLTSNINQYLYRRWGCTNFFFQPYAANPYVFRPHPEEEEILESVFLGTPHSSRANMINNLLKAEIPVNLYGKTSNTRIGNAQDISRRNILNTTSRYLSFSVGRKILMANIIQNKRGTGVINEESMFLKTYPSVPDFGDIGKIYSRYALSLTCAPARNTIVLKKPIFGMDLRTFEIAMSGGVMFCMENEEIIREFEKDKEVVTYRDFEEMKEKAAYYLRPENKKIRDKLRVNIRRRAENDHSWFKRFEFVFVNLGIKGYE